jgi:two-component sensor histidine kinase
MNHPFWNWRTLMVVIAFLIVMGCLWITSRIVKDISNEEELKIKTFATAIESISNHQEGNADLAGFILESNKTIPAILCKTNGEIIETINLDPEDKKANLALFKKLHPPIEVSITPKQYIYYGESKVLKMLRFFPLVLLGITGIFLGIVILAYHTSSRSMQNRVWVGMAKETAHQLGTPLSSLIGWIEYLKLQGQSQIADEIAKDIDRLQLVAERFSKIGSQPELNTEDISSRIQKVVEYMRLRSPKNVTIHFDGIPDLFIPINGSLLEWVIENLIRNALDAMDGKGNIYISIRNTPLSADIRIKDDGKGMSPATAKKIFRPGFTTKSRGWGLGLSLAKRIIEKYHNGNIDVIHSEIGTGTTFKIELFK